MRRLDLTFTALLVPLDFLALLGAAITAYLLRFSDFFVAIRPILTNIPLSQWLATGVGFALIWMALFAIAGLYTFQPRRAWSELARIILACTAGIMIVIAIVFFRREFTTSRFLVGAVWGLAIFYVWFGRLFLRLIRRALLSARIGHQKIVIIGDSKAARDLANLYRARPVLGFTVAKTFTDWNNEAKKELESMAKRRTVNSVLLADPDISKDKALEIISLSETLHFNFRYLADLFTARFRNIEMSTVSGIPVMEIKRTPLDGWGRIAKRIFDIIFSSFVILVTSPVLIIVSVLRLIEDGFPIIFQNDRVGEQGLPFRLYKFRSMWAKYCIGPQFVTSTSQNLSLEKKLIEEKGIKEGPVYKIANDPRVTPVGRFIRRWSIDELAQFFNVLKGEMSVVGPRPHQPREVDKYKPHHRRVLAIKPGITGMAQISGRSDLDFDEEVRLDTWYIENWSLWLDFYIILKTPFSVFAHKGAY